MLVAMSAPRHPGPWVAIVGDRGSRRDEVREAVARALEDGGLRLGGVRQEAIFEGDEHVGYDVIDLASGARLSLARESTTPRLCRWDFDTTAFERMRGAAREGDYDAVAFDVASLESSGEGHWPAITEALAEERLVILTLRPRVVGPVALRLADPLAGLELPTTNADIEAFAAEVTGHARALRTRRAG